MEYIYHMGLVRCKGRLALELQDYISNKEMDIKSFLDGKPGNEIFLVQ